MERVSITLRFILKVSKSDVTEIAEVNWQDDGKEKGKNEFSNKIILKKLNETEYSNDIRITRHHGSRINFQFVHKTKAGGFTYFEKSQFTFSKNLSSPLEICEVSKSCADPSPNVLRFKMNYFTYFGQNIFIIGSTRKLGYWDPKHAFSLSHIGSNSSDPHLDTQLFSDRGYNWQNDLELPALPSSIQYRYICIEGDKITYEPFPRVISFKCCQKGFIELNDIWRWLWHSYSLYSATYFTKIGNHSQLAISEQESNTVRCVFRVSASIFSKDMTLRIVGSVPQLGSWNEANGVDVVSWHRDVHEGKPLTECLSFFAIVDIPASLFPFEYKFVAVPLKSSTSAIWESHENRKATISNSNVNAAFFDSWHVKFPDISFHGSAVFFSFNSVRSMCPYQPISIISRVGDWASKCGFSHIQVADIFDHSASSSSHEEELPVSGYALNPALIDLDSYGYNYSNNNYDSQLQFTDMLSFIEQKVLPEHWEEFKDDVELFVKENNFWLNDYIKLCSRARFETEVADEKFSRLISFTQYLLYRQLNESISYCASLHIAVGLDLPFALSEFSAEARYSPKLFMEDYKLGIPPSKAKPIGKVLSAFPFDMKNCAEWITQRVQHFGNIFSAIRLLSTLYYFSQWIVPTDKCIRAVFGHFEPTMSISCAELETWGLWDIDRYSRPYIRENDMNAMFGLDAPEIESTFMTTLPDGTLCFKPNLSEEVSLMTAKLDERGEMLRNKYAKKLLRLLGEVLLVKNSDGDFTPRPGLSIAADESGEESLSFKALPPYEQTAIFRLKDEFMQNKQKCLWSSQGRTIVEQIRASTQALLISDASGEKGDVCDDVLQNTTIVPLRVAIEGKGNSSFDDVRSYKFLNVATPTMNSNPQLSFLWDKGLIATKKMWEEELWESGQAPTRFNEDVAKKIMIQHCWCSAMIAMFPLDTLPYAVNYLVQSKTSQYGAMKLDYFLKDENAVEEISKILEQTKRRN